MKSIAPFILFTIITCAAAVAQTSKPIDSLRTSYQACLDKGANMLGCTKQFYHQMDSMLNVAYNKLRAACDSTQKENLKDDQLQWLSERDAYFKKTLKEFKDKNPAISPYGGAFGAQDDAMFMFDDNARFVEERALDLLQKCTADNFSPQNYKVEPMGHYDMDNKVEKRNGETYGYFGDIEVKQLTASKVVVRLFICKGAPSYNSGTAMDTLTITNNKAVYTTSYDSSCRVVFSFYKRGIRVEEFSDDMGSGCGFGHAVVAHGFFRKTSAKIPTDKELNEN